MEYEAKLGKDQFRRIFCDSPEAFEEIRKIHFPDVPSDSWKLLPKESNGKK